MPTTYAHYRFGDHCLKQLPQNLQAIINNNRDIFNYGVHGPDFFFYYNCLKWNDVNKYGHDLHNVPFKETVIKMKPLYEKADDKNSVLSYLLGFTCHFMLDSYCHGFIDLIDQTTDVSHGKLESQLDRYLLLKDGYTNPNKYDRAKSLKPTKKIGHDIHTVFPEFDEDTIYKSIKDQKFYCTLLNDNNSFKRFILKTAMEKFNAKSFIDLLLTDENDPRCKAYLLRCEKYFDKAVEHYPIIAESLVKFILEGKELDPYFKNHFNPKEDYKQIPVLNFTDELDFKVDFQK